MTDRVEYLSMPQALDRLLGAAILSVALKRAASCVKLWTAPRRRPRLQGWQRR